MHATIILAIIKLESTDAISVLFTSHIGVIFFANTGISFFGKQNNWLYIHIIIYTNLYKFRKI